MAGALVTCPGYTFNVPLIQPGVTWEGKPQWPNSPDQTGLWTSGGGGHFDCSLCRWYHAQGRWCWAAQASCLSRSLPVSQQQATFSKGFYFRFLPEFLQGWTVNWNCKPICFPKLLLVRLFFFNHHTESKMGHHSLEQTQPFLNRCLCWPLSKL